MAKAPVKPLSWSQIAKVQRELLGRLRRDGDEHVVAVGVGIKNGLTKRPRWTDGLSAIFVVKKRVPKRRLHPKTTMGGERCHHVNVGTSGRPRQLRLASDVIELSAFKPVAQGIGNNERSGTAGYLAHWGGTNSRHFGVITAGHVMGPKAAGLEAPIITLPSGAPGQLPIAAALGIAYRPTFGKKPDGTDDPDSSPTAAFDIALVEFEAADAQRLNPTLAWPDPPKVPIADIDAVDLNQPRDDCAFRSRGRKLPVDVAAAFAHFPASVEGWPALQFIYVLQPYGPAPARPFNKGTSGSALDIEQSAAPFAMLLAAGANDRGEPFTRGVAQSLAKSIAYLREQPGLADLEIIGGC